jgi:hypothetical protein
VILLYFCLPNIINPMYIQQLREMAPPPCKNTVGVCNQITLLILSYISSRLVTLLKVNDAPIQVPDIFDLTVSFKFINFSFQIFLLFVPEMSASFMSYIVQIIYIALVGSCKQCILACFLLSTKPEHSSSNHGLCCFNSYRPRLSLAEDLNVLPSHIYVLTITYVLQSCKPA